RHRGVALPSLHRRNARRRERRSRPDPTRRARRVFPDDRRKLHATQLRAQAVERPRRADDDRVLSESVLRRRLRALARAGFHPDDALGGLPATLSDMTARCLMVQGTASGLAKSLLTPPLCPTFAPRAHPSA